MNHHHHVCYVHPRGTSHHHVPPHHTGNVPRMSCQFNVPILVVILTATLLSTSSSMAGGLILYFQGLEALEDSVADTSLGEVTSLRDKLLAQLKLVEDSTQTLKKFVYSSERIHDNNPEEWASIIRSLAYAQVSGSDVLYDSTMSLATYDTTNSSAFYAGVWGDVLKNGSRELVFGAYGNHLNVTENFLVANGTVQEMLIPSYSLHSDTGHVNEFVYNWDGNPRYIDIIKHYDPRNGKDNKTHEEFLWTDPPVAGSVCSRWFTPRRWYASDGNMYAYTELEAIYIPPPPPHPWSTYKSVSMLVGFLFTSFQPSFEEYKKMRPDTTVMLVDRASRTIYASTEGGMIPTWCQVQASEAANEDVALGCSFNIADLTPALQQGFEKLGDERFGSFTQKKLDGTAYFLRREYSHQNLELLWMRPTSSVQGKVEEALRLLIVFTMLVLVFDVMISVAEVVFIAMPMKKLSSAIRLIGDMDTELAADTIAQYEAKSVMVREMRDLMSGMSLTVNRLEEFRAFMPESILPAAREEDACTSEPSVTNNSFTYSRSSVHSRSSVSRSAVSSHACAPNRAHLDLYLSSKPIGLLAVNVVGWWGSMGNMANDTLLQSHTDIVTNVMSMCNIQGGILDSFSGDRFLVGWNTVKPKADFVVRTITTALSIHENMRDYKVSCAATSGKAKVGNTGNKSVRRFTILSPLVPWLMEMERLNKERRLKVTVDDRTATKLKNIFLYQLTDAIRCDKQKAVIKVHNVISKVTVVHNEWMYELEQAQREDNNDKVNIFVGRVIDEQWDKITEAVTLDKALHHITAAYEAKCFQPLLLRFERTAHLPTPRLLEHSSSE